MKSSSIFRVIAVTAALGLMTTLAGCSAQEPEGLTLAQSKSPVQLLRNEAASRVPPTLVSDVSTVSDGSSNCRSAEVDPKGLQRKWQSSALITLQPEADFQLVMSKFLLSFAEDGWEQGTYGSDSIIEFTRPDSVADIHISSKIPKDGGAPQIKLKVGGPCVMTDGADSAEVTMLDTKAAASIE